MKKLIPFYTVIPLLLSCSTIPTATQDTIDEAFSGSDTHAPINKTQELPSEVSDALVPNYNQSLFASYHPSAPTKFNISIHEAEARDFFMGLVVDSDENMMVHPEVNGLISLELKNVTVAQVMDAVQKVYGYDYKKNDIGYIVYPATLQTKIFKLNRLDLLRQGESNTRVTSGQSSDSSEEGSSGSSDTEESSGSSSSGSWIKTQTNSDAWREINLALQSILSIDPEATVIINRQSGAIVVRAKPMQLREVEDFLALTQKQSNRQVIIEAKIIEIILDDSHQAGVNWQSIIRDGLTSAPLLTGINPLTSLNSFRNIFTVGGSWGDFSAYVELLETQGKANILSSPRISTINNQKAIIKVGRDEFFITSIRSDSEQSSSGGEPTQSQEITFSPFFSGIALDVTPQINDNDEVTLHIHPSITRVEDQEKTFIINGQEGALPLALNTVRESDSIIKAKNGQIVVIGGLMQETTQENKRGITGLTQIPYLGNLFRVNTGEVKKSELVILLKPTIINGDGDWRPSMDLSRKHLNQLNNHPLWK
ncbi:MAG: pilus (MSHA type) biogenesis protein MshL [Methylococcales bacterium]|nr:pilus (MSHA type) biogenesis protein MshL [Methylococcales bacterium]